MNNLQEIEGKKTEGNDFFKELGGLPTGNPFTLFAYAFRQGRKDECLEILTNIHFYIFRKAPTAALRKLWKRELGSPADRYVNRDFTIKIVRNRVKSDRHYYLELRSDECVLNYSDESNAMSLDCGPQLNIVRRGLQLEGRTCRAFFPGRD